MTLLDLILKLFWIRQIRCPPVLITAMVSRLLRLINPWSLLAMHRYAILLRQYQLLSYHLSHLFFLPRRTKLQSRLFCPAATLVPILIHPKSDESRALRHIRGTLTMESMVPIPTPRHRPSPLFRLMGLTRRMGNCCHASTGYPLLHFGNPTAEHRRSHPNLANNQRND